MVLEPKSAGPHPAVILISAWGGGSTQNIMPATRLAEKGYVVVAYGARGFGEAGGEVDVSGPLDVADVSTVIDWTIGNTATDTARIGVGAVSYGAGIALIASAFDNRIRSIASMSGWFDLVHSLSRDETRRGAATQVLYLSGLANGDLSDESDWMLRAFFEENPDPEHTETLKAWARVRSPGTYLDKINQNRPALLIEHTFSETVFPPDQMVDLYNRFQGTKRLDLVWFSPRLSSKTKVRGDIRAHLRVTPSAKTGTLIAYLFDVDGGNTGRLINSLPYGWTEATPGQSIPVDLKYSETAYDLPAGHRLALVVDTTDPLYIDWNAGQGPMTFGSPASDPSYVDIPVAR